MKKNFVIITGSFHKEEAKIMVDEAKQTIENAGHAVSEIIWVPGSYEAPLALKRVLHRPDIDAAVILGIIERGETAHGLVMGHCVGHKILDIELDAMKPVGLGILGPEILPDQIPPRVKPYAIDAAKAAIAMLEIS